MDILGAPKYILIQRYHHLKPFQSTWQVIEQLLDHYMKCLTNKISPNLGLLHKNE